MDPDDQLRLRVNYKLMVENVQFIEVRDQLSMEEIFDDEELTRIGNIVTEQAKIRELLRLLPKRGHEAYSVWCAALRENEAIYGHILESLAATDLVKARAKYGSIGETSSGAHEENELRMKSNYKNLIDSVRFIEVRDSLYQDGSLSDHDVEVLDRMSNKTDKEQMRELLKIIKANGRMKSFFDAVSQCKCHQALLEKIERTDLDEARKRFSSQNKLRHIQNLQRENSENSANNWRVDLSKEYGVYSPHSTGKVDFSKAIAIMCKESLCITNWKRLRALPGLVETDIMCVHIAHATSDGPLECIHQVIVTWQRKCGSAATVEVLVQTLIELGFRFTAERIKSAYNVP